jgi:hypothetical protein
MRSLRAPAAAVALVAAIAGALAAPPRASALDCPRVRIEKRYELAEAAFVGRIVGTRPAPGGGSELLYRFRVEQAAKGSLGRELEVRAAPLVDADDKPVLRDTSIGVFLTYEGAVPTTTSCALTDPGALLEVSDRPKGTAIKLGVGVVILAAVLVFSMVRLKRRQQQLRGKAPT